MGGTKPGFSLGRLLSNKVTRPPAELAMRGLLSFGAIRTGLNRRYERASPRTKARFASLFSRAFWNTSSSGWSGEWTLSFAGKRFRVPLRPDSINLDWIYATSILTHDTEVVATYENFLRSRSEKPALFLDIGANYGMHSLLFSVAGVPVVAIEPNPNCRVYAEGIFAANGVHPDVRGLAVGDRQGKVSLVVPEGESWLGTIMPEVGEWLRGKREVTTFEVELRTLDDFGFDARPMLIKIDIEGAEEAVLRGARELVGRVRPSIIFESYGEEKREQIASVLDSYEYRLHALPFDPDAPSAPLSTNAFVRSAEANFIARPAQDPITRN